MVIAAGPEVGVLNDEYVFFLPCFGFRSEITTLSEIFPFFPIILIWKQRMRHEMLRAAQHVLTIAASNCEKVQEDLSRSRKGFNILVVLGPMPSPPAAPSTEYFTAIMATFFDTAFLAKSFQASTETSLRCRC